MLLRTLSPCFYKYKTIIFEETILPDREFPYFHAKDVLGQRKMDDVFLNDKCLFLGLRLASTSGDHSIAVLLDCQLNIRGSGQLNNAWFSLPTKGSFQI